MSVEGATRALFELGAILATPGALEALDEAQMQAGELILMHVQLMQGELSDEDHKHNIRAVRTGEERVFSSYKLPTGVKIWLITEATREVTTLLLPSEY